MTLTFRDYAYVLIQFALFGVYVLEPDWLALNLPTSLRYLGLVMSILGGLVMTLALLQLNRSLSPFPTPKVDGILIETGLYRYVRHPIYTGIILLLLGYGLYAVSAYKLVIVLLLWGLFYLKSSYEETRLVQTYTGYQAYRQRTGRFWPRSQR